MAQGLVAADLRNSTEEELDSKLAEAKTELFNLRFQAATGQLESHGRLRAVRKEIARIYTVKRERELGIVTAGGRGGRQMSEAAGHGRAQARGYRKVREGYVVSDKMDKTVVVEVEDRVKHPKYGKVIRRTKKYKAHDGENACGVGDRVRLDGDPAAVGDQALAGRRDPGEGQVSTGTPHQNHPRPAWPARRPASGSRS